MWVCILQSGAIPSDALRVREMEWVMRPTVGGERVEWHAELGPQIHSIWRHRAVFRQKTHNSITETVGKWARFAFLGKFLLRTALGSRHGLVGRGRRDLGQIWLLKGRTQAKATGTRRRELESSDLNQEGKQMNVSEYVSKGKVCVRGKRDHLMWFYHCALLSVYGTESQHSRLTVLS